MWYTYDFIAWINIMLVKWNLTISVLVSFRASKGFKSNHIEKDIVREMERYYRSRLLNN